MLSPSAKNRLAAILEPIGQEELNVDPEWKMLSKPLTPVEFMNSTDWQTWINESDARLQVLV
eukprot:7553795-Prorocentrum_lima.AAC.1